LDILLEKKVRAHPPGFNVRWNDIDKVYQELFTPYDVFVSYAFEDNAKFIRPLVRQLEKEFKLRVWYAELRLRLGEPLTQQINRGLSESLFAVVVFSSSFFKKSWPQRELNALSQLSLKDSRRILPVWYKIRREEVARNCPLFSDLVALRSEMGLRRVARAIAKHAREV
jgi:hypothetical protein